MINDRARIKDWVANCTEDPLTVNHQLYVPLHALNLEDGKVLNLRGEDWLEPLFKRISLSKRPVCQLFSGFSGTGKTTELRRLEKKLTDWDYIVLWADAKDYLDLSHPLVIEDLTILLAASFGEAAERRFPGMGLVKDNYWKRFKEFMSDTELELGSLGLGKTINLKTALFHGNAPMWLEVRRRLKATLGSLKSSAHAYVQEVIESIKTDSGAEVVFILDSLEKLRGPASRFQENMESVVEVFSSHHDILKLPDCHVIFTVPPYASLQGTNTAQFYDNHLSKPLPAIKVLEKDKDEMIPAQDGLRGLRKVLAKRVPLHEIFGEREDLLNTMIVYSGGNLRFLLGMVEDLIIDHSDKDFPVDEKAVDKIIRHRKEDRTRSIRPEHVTLLFSVHESHDIKEIRDEDLAVLARYMDAYMVLCYQNGDGWFEIHPLIRDDIRLRMDALNQAADQEGESQTSTGPST